MLAKAVAGGMGVPLLKLDFGTLDYSFNHTTLLTTARPRKPGSNCARN